MKIIRFVCLILAVSFYPVLFTLASEPDSNSKNTLIEESRIVSKFPTDAFVYPQSIKASFDFNHVSYVIKKDSKFHVVIDDNIGASYDGIDRDTPVFSPDSQRYAYLANRSSSWFMIVDGKENGPYEGVGIPVFSPDSRHVAYNAQKDKEHFVVIDGISKPSYGFLVLKRGILFSHDSDTIVYATFTKNKKWHVIINDKVSPPYAGVGIFLFSKDSKRLAYTASEDNKKWFINEDGFKGPFFELLSFITYSPDSKHLAYAGKSNDEWSLIIDNKPQEKKFSVIHLITYSPNSGLLAYCFKGDDEKWFVHTGNNEEGPYDKVLAPLLFSPDSKHFSYRITKGENVHSVKDNKIGMAYNKIENLTFSPDSSHLAYMALKGEKWVMVLDGVEGPPYENIGIPVFSNDSRRFIYSALKEKKGVINLDGKEYGTFDLISDSPPVFSDDSKNAACLISTEGKWHVWVNGITTDTFFESFAKGSVVAFVENNNKIHTLGFNFLKCEFINFNVVIK